MKSKSQNLVLFFILFALNIVAQDKIYQKPITHLSFGSCNRAGLHPEVWKTIGLFVCLLVWGGVIAMKTKILNTSV